MGMKQLTHGEDTLLAIAQAFSFKCLLPAQTWVRPAALRRCSRPGVVGAACLGGQECWVVNNSGGRQQVWGSRKEGIGPLQDP